jgi:hypothetical protein
VARADRDTPQAQSPGFQDWFPRRIDPIVTDDKRFADYDVAMLPT